MKMLFEAEYYLYNKKDVDRYCRDMDTYFARLGEGVGYRDYLGAVDALYEALGEKLTIEVAKHGAVWLQNALKFPVKPDEQMSYHAWGLFQDDGRKREGQEELRTGIRGVIAV